MESLQASVYETCQALSHTVCPNTDNGRRHDKDQSLTQAQEPEDRCVSFPLEP